MHNNLERKMSVSAVSGRPDAKLKGLGFVLKPKGPVAAFQLQQLLVLLLLQPHVCCSS